MIFLVILLTFFATVCILMVVVYATGPQVVDIAERLTGVMKPPVSDLELEAANSGGQRARNVLVSVGKILPQQKGKQTSRDQILLTRAGYRSDDGVLVLRGLKIVCAIGFFFGSIWSGLSQLNPTFLPVLAAIAGWVAPEFWVQSRVRARQKTLRLSLPDAMDLMVVCVEVGLGLDQAILKVSEELRLVHPELSGELQMVNMEMRVGKTRIEALRELGTRTGLDDIKALIAILVQTDRFGTSIVQALRTFSDELRTKRRQRAEEMSAKVSVKMVPPLVFFIFLALMVVVLGPAVITVLRVLLPAMK
jgi:tight adherence protein C